MTIIVVGDEQFTTSIVPAEQGAHDMSSHDADKTTPDVHDHDGNFHIDGTLTVDELITGNYAIITPTLDATTKIEVRDVATSASTTLRDGNSTLGSIVVSNGTNTTFAVDKDGQIEAHTGVGAPILRADTYVQTPTVNASALIQVKDQATNAATTLRDGNSAQFAIHVTSV